MSLLLPAISLSVRPAICRQEQHERTQEVLHLKAQAELVPVRVPHVATSICGKLRHCCVA